MLVLCVARSLFGSCVLLLWLVLCVFFPGGVVRRSLGDFEFFRHFWGFVVKAEKSGQLVAPWIIKS